MQLLIDRLPFHRWTDATRSPPQTDWTIVLPIVPAEPGLLVPPPLIAPQDWVLDTGNRGEALAWRLHLTQAGVDPDQGRLPRPLRLRSVGGYVTVPVRDVDLWLLSDLPPATAPPPCRLVLKKGLPFLDVTTRLDPYFDRPLLGIRALRKAGLRVEIDFAADTVSVWVPGPSGP